MSEALERPTMNIRLVEVGGDDNKIGALVLQQQWLLAGGKREWRDVPMMDELTGEEVCPRTSGVKTFDARPEEPAPPAPAPAPEKGPPDDSVPSDLFV